MFLVLGNRWGGPAKEAWEIGGFSWLLFFHNPALSIGKLWKIASNGNLRKKKPAPLAARSWSTSSRHRRRPRRRLEAKRSSKLTSPQGFCWCYIYSWDRLTPHDATTWFFIFFFHSLIDLDWLFGIVAKYFLPKTCFRTAMNQGGTANLMAGRTRLHHNSISRFMMGSIRHLTKATWYHNTS